MRFLLIPLGSHGDVHPFLAIGKELRRRGHEPIVLTLHYFQAMVERAGLPMVPMGEPGEFEKAIENPDLWHPRRALGVIFRELILRGMRETYQTIEQQLEAGNTVLVAPASAFGARIARDALQVPLATINLQPFTLPSAHAMPVLPGAGSWLAGAPVWFNRGVLWAADALVVDRVLGPETNRFRSELGLPPVKRIATRWCLSPDLILGLWPDWFAGPQVDWPPQVRLSGFPLYDEADTTPLPAELLRFLDDGPPPLVFTLGSAQRHGSWFFERSVAVARRLGLRALLLARYKEQIPAHLPDGLMHVAYAPFSRLLPQCLAMIHHGGIGTTAQALATARPQLVVPLAHDQYDNAARITRLGVGDWLSPRYYTIDRAAQRLERLLGDATVTAAAKKVSHQIAHATPLKETCDWLEELAGRRRQ